MSSEGSPFREGPASNVAPIVVRYVLFHGTQVLALGVFASLFLWAFWNETGLQLWKHLGSGALFLFILTAPSMPVITVRARVEGGHLIVSGRRWPGAETIWSCTLPEAAGFQVEVVAGEKRKPFRRIALRTTEGALLGLTEHTYAGRPERHAAVAARLNAWWNAASRSSR